MDVVLSQEPVSHSERHGRDVCGILTSVQGIFGSGQSTQQRGAVTLFVGKESSCSGILIQVMGRDLRDKVARVH